MKEKGLLQTWKSFSGAGQNRATCLSGPSARQRTWKAVQCLSLQFPKGASAANHLGKPQAKEDFSTFLDCQGAVCQDRVGKSPRTQPCSQAAAATRLAALRRGAVLLHTPQVTVQRNSRHRSDPFFPRTRHLPPLWAEARTSPCFLVPSRCSWNRGCSGYLPYHRLHPLGHRASRPCALPLHLLLRVRGYLSASFLPVSALALPPCSPLTQDVRTTGLKNQALYTAGTFPVMVGARKEKKGNIVLIT